MAETVLVGGPLSGATVALENDPYRVTYLEVPTIRTGVSEVRVQRYRGTIHAYVRVETEDGPTYQYEEK